MGEHRYLLSYNLDLKKGPFTKEELKEKRIGGTDALVIASIIKGNEFGEPHEGTKSIAFVTVDGRKGIDNIPNTELFQVFANLAKYLSENCTGYQQQIAKATFDNVKNIMQNKKGFLDSLSKNLFE